MTTKNKSDEEVMFNEEEISGIKVKPWSFGTLFDISALLDVVLDKAGEKGLLATLEKEFTEGTLNYITLTRLFTLASKQMLAILSIGCEVEESKVRKLSMEDGVRLAYTVYRQNSSSIKNAFTLVSALKEKPENEGEEQ